MRLVPPFHAAGVPAEESPRDRRLLTGVCGLALALALFATGCGVKGADNANLIEGKQDFVAKCG